jgi:hypothetical protein
MDVYLSTVSNRLNAVVKQLAVIATIFLPLTFITGFFGQNFGRLIDRPAVRLSSSASASARRSSLCWHCSRSSSAAAGRNGHRLARCPPFSSSGNR